MAFNAIVGSTILASLSFSDAAGNAARVDGAPSWSVSPDGAAVVTPSSDGLSATIVVNALGPVQITADADADLGTGVRSLLVIGEIEGVAGEAVAGTMSFVAS